MKIETFFFLIFLVESEHLDSVSKVSFFTFLIPRIKCSKGIPQNVYPKPRESRKIIGCGALVYPKHCSKLFPWEQYWTMGSTKARFQNNRRIYQCGGSEFMNHISNISQKPIQLYKKCILLQCKFIQICDIPLASVFNHHFRQKLLFSFVTINLWSYKRKLGICFLFK